MTETHSNVKNTKTAEKLPKLTPPKSSMLENNPTMRRTQLDSSSSFRDGHLGHVVATLPQIVGILAILATLQKQAISEGHPP
jgi:hypothetical protein